MPFALSAEREREMQDIFSRYPNKLAACIPLLRLCQEQNGWVSDDIIRFVAERCATSPAHVAGVASFYTLFHERPAGKHQIWVCQTLSCALRGADDILHHCEKRLGVRSGETTKDGSFTLQTAECLASCGTGPVMRVDATYHENLNIEQADRILDGLVEKGS